MERSVYGEGAFLAEFGSGGCRSGLCRDTARPDAGHAVSCGNECVRASGRPRLGVPLETCRDALERVRIEELRALSSDDSARAFAKPPLGFTSTNIQSTLNNGIHLLP